MGNENRCKMPKDFFVCSPNGTLRAATKGIIGLEQDFNVLVLFADSFHEFGKEAFTDSVSSNVDSRNIFSIGRDLELDVRVPEER